MLKDTRKHNSWKCSYKQLIIVYYLFIKVGGLNTKLILNVLISNIMLLIYWQAYFDYETELHIPLNLIIRMRDFFR